MRTTWGIRKKTQTRHSFVQEQTVWSHFQKGCDPELIGRFFFNGLPRWVFLQTRVGAGLANRVNGFGPGRPMGQKILTGWVTARVFNGSIILVHQLIGMFINKWQNFLTFTNWICILCFKWTPKNLNTWELMSTHINETKRNFKVLEVNIRIKRSYRTNTKKNSKSSSSSSFSKSNLSKFSSKKS